MKLRRALVTAAATAAIAPIALLSAPAAFADPAPGATAETTATTPAPQETETQTPPAEETPAEETPAETPQTDNPGTGDTPPGEVAPVTPPEKTDEPTDGPTDEPTDEADECSKYEDSPGTLAELRGLPSKIVAGSGWHGFTFRVSNYTGENFESVSAGLYAFAFQYNEDATEISRYLHVQWSDGSVWQNIDTEIDADDFADLGSLAPKKHADLKLRIKVDAKAPSGLGGSMAFATSVNADGVCGFSVPEDQEYRFEILAAGNATPSTVPPATSTPEPSNTPAPQSSSTPLAGSLAATGSSSMLPTVGVIGGLAVVAGAGVVYSVRRRKVSNEA
ncbi:peptidase [Streptomyces sp. SID8379]|uniref:LPXTG cell wall anchor domain-containing protein n=1 Tax=unclassified Streptomyces TaxID=2593676 RepID=UPI0003608D75|nr:MULTISPECIES: LPXTG cell wall anchor domain-containing protein [unclassified Streptomyces]MYW68358.1 peptidase [Streptomyces sp. SID8379]